VGRGCGVVTRGCEGLVGGAGFVANSDPGAELQETEIKLKARLEAMLASTEQAATPLANTQAGRQARHS